MHKKGDIVHLIGFSGTWEVMQGADTDGEVTIKDKDGKGWFYVPKDFVIGAKKPMAPPMSTETKVFTNQSIQKEETHMNNANNRQVALVTLIDTDAGLKPELAMIKHFDTVVFDGDVDNMKMKLVMDNDMAGILAKHNEKRGKEIDLKLRQSSGQELKLLPVELSDLKWVIDVK